MSPVGGFEEAADAMVERKKIAGVRAAGISNV
jgi:hypothetical protein